MAQKANGHRTANTTPKRRRARARIKKLATLAANQYRVRLRVGGRNRKSLVKNVERQLRQAFQAEGLKVKKLTVGYTSDSADDFWENPPPPDKEKDVILSCINSFNMDTGEWEILCVAMEVSDEPVPA